MTCVTLNTTGYGGWNAIPLSQQEVKQGVGTRLSMRRKVINPSPHLRSLTKRAVDFGGLCVISEFYLPFVLSGLVALSYPPPKPLTPVRFSAGGIDFLGELQEARPCGVTYAVTASLSRSIAFAGT